MGRWLPASPSAVPLGAGREEEAGSKQGGNRKHIIHTCTANMFMKKETKETDFSPCAPKTNLYIFIGCQILKIYPHYERKPIRKNSNISRGSQYLRRGKGMSIKLVKFITWNTPTRIAQQCKQMLICTATSFLTHTARLKTNSRFHTKYRNTLEYNCARIYWHNHRSLFGKRYKYSPEGFRYD